MLCRYCVENPDIIATRFDNAPVSIFQKGAQYPVCVLEGELAEGFALDWKPAGLLTGDTKGSIYVWKNVE